MAYFANGSDTAGINFDNQCENCPLGEEPCPIAFCQLHYNYEQCGNKLAESILLKLVNKNGICSMKKYLKKPFIDKNQLNLF